MSVLPLFKPLPIVRDVRREDELSASEREYDRDAITLGWEDRLKARARRVSDRGLEFGTALPRGTVLRSGHCLVLDDARVIVMVVERDEPVFVIEPSSSEEWGLLAYHVGNNHQPLMIAAGAIICPDVPGMAQLLDQHGIEYFRSTRPFTPVGLLPDHRH
jgi:urease accessory protein